MEVLGILFVGYWMGYGFLVVWEEDVGGCGEGCWGGGVIFMWILLGLVCYVMGCFDGNVGIGYVW